MARIIGSLPRNNRTAMPLDYPQDAGMVGRCGKRTVCSPFVSSDEWRFPLQTPRLKITKSILNNNRNGRPFERR